MPERTGVFFDRDGIINRSPPADLRYVTRPDEFHLLPGTPRAIRQLNQAGIPVGVVTNQKGISLGRYSLRDLDEIHVHMRALLAEQGAVVDHIEFCPHQESDHCSCRKPLPGMILSAARILDVDPASSWMVGDQLRDLVAGKAAGCRTLGVGLEGIPSETADALVGHTGELPAWFAQHFPFQKAEDLQ